MARRPQVPRYPLLLSQNSGCLLQTEGPRWRTSSGCCGERILVNLGIASTI